MGERWPGYHRGALPPGAEAEVRHHRHGAEWVDHLEVRWDGLPGDFDGGRWRRHGHRAGWIDLGPLPSYLTSAHRIDWAAHLDWAAIADDHLPEGT